MLLRLIDFKAVNLASDIPKKQGGPVYHQAIKDWLMEDLTHIEAFLAGEPLRFYNHQKDSNGKLIKCSVKIDL